MADGTSTALPAPQPISTLPPPQPLDAAGLPQPQPLTTKFTQLPPPVPLPAPQPISATSSTIQAPGGPTSISPAPPLSVWQRITRAFSEGVPELNPKFEAASHTDTGKLTTGETPQMQLVTPEAAMTETEQKRHPILTGAGQAVGGLTTPQSVAMLAATGGLGQLPGAAGKIVTRLMSAGFSAQAIASAYKASAQARDAFERGDTSEGERLLTQALITAGVGGLGAAHAATGKPAITGKAKSAEAEALSPKQIIENEGMVYKGEVTPGSDVHQFEDPNNPGKTAALHAKDIIPENVRAKMSSKLNEFRTQPLPADSPVATLINQPAPAVHLVDSEAAKQSIENQQTISQPRATVPIRVFHGTSAEAVTDISKLDASYSKTGVAGRGIYVTANAEQAGNYAGPEAIATGGRVVAGNLRPNVQLLDANEPLPEPILRAARTEFAADIKGAPTSYLDFVDQLQEGVGDVGKFQKFVADQAGVDGVRYTAEYPSGTRSGILLFGRDISGKGAADLFQQTVPTARVVSQDYVPAISQDQVLAARIQQIVNNSGEMQRLGVDPAQIKTPEDVTNMLARLSDHIGSNGDPRLATITFATQRQLAADLGMSVEDLLARKSGTAFNAEQALASRALLNASSGRVLDLASQAASDPARLNEFTDALAQHQAVMDSVRGVTAEAGRALGSFRNEPPTQVRIANTLAGLSDSAKAEAATLLSKLDVNDQRAVNDFVAKIKPATPADKLFEYYRNALLSSPHVVAVKAASEAAMMALETTKKVVTAGLTKLKGGEDQRYASEAWWYAKGAIQALTHAKDVLTGKFKIEDAPGFEDRLEQQAIKGPLGTIIRTPMRVLSRETNLVFVLNYFGELNAQAARLAIREGLDGNELHARQAYLAENPTPAMTDAANKLALENTFQSKLARFGGTIQHSITVEPTGVARFLFPFYKTPINLIKESFGYSPYGLLKGLVKVDVDTTAKGLIGSSIAAGVAKLALDGYVTGGGPIDFRKRQTLEATGWQPYSIKIGGRYYSYHRAEPLGLALSLVADTVHGAFTHDDPEVTQSKADNAVAHIARNVSDFPFLMTFSNLSELTQGDPSTMAERFIGHLVSGFVPSALGNVAQATDRTIRRPTTIPEFVETKIPGMTARVPAYIDINGQSAQRPVSGLGGANPFPVSAATNDPATNELARLGIPTPQPIKNVSAKGHSFPVTPTESQALLQREGRELHSVLLEFVANPAWQTFDDPMRRKIVAKVRADVAKDRIVKLAQMRAGQQTAANQ